MKRKEHWEEIYKTKTSTEVSWYQAEPHLSVSLLREAGANPESRLIDVGGGDSTLVDAVISQHLGHMTVLDLSEVALNRARMRLGNRASEVDWLEADITNVALPESTFDIWHDRAVFHFLTTPEDRALYARTATKAIKPGGTVIIAAFAYEGPTHCSGLKIVRYRPEELAAELGDAFILIRGFGSIHHTPTGKEQNFSVAILRRR